MPVDPPSGSSGPPHDPPSSTNATVATNLALSDVPWSGAIAHGADSPKAVEHTAAPLVSEAQVRKLLPHALSEQVQFICRHLTWREFRSLYDEVVMELTAALEPGMTTSAPALVAGPEASGPSGPSPSPRTADRNPLPAAPSAPVGMSSTGPSAALDDPEPAVASATDERSTGQRREGDEGSGAPGLDELGGDGAEPSPRLHTMSLHFAAAKRLVAKIQHKLDAAKTSARKAPTAGRRARRAASTPQEESRPDATQRVAKHRRLAPHRLPPGTTREAAVTPTADHRDDLRTSAAEGPGPDSAALAPEEVRTTAVARPDPPRTAQGSFIGRGFHESL